MRPSLVSRVLLTLMTLSWPLLANAEYESTTLFRKGAWIVELTYDTNDGTLWCSAETKNNKAQLLSITAFDEGGLILFVFDDGWNISERPIEFILDVDYSRWTMSGHGQENSISIAMNDHEKAVKFLVELMEGSAVALYNSSERRLATFSLTGSSSSIRKLFEWFERISIDSSDPFKSSQDPF